MHGRQWWDYWAEIEGAVSETVVTLEDVVAFDDWTSCDWLHSLYRNWFSIHHFQRIHRMRRYPDPRDHRLVAFGDCSIFFSFGDCYEWTATRWWSTGQSVCNRNSYQRGSAWFLIGGIWECNELKIKSRHTSDCSLSWDEIESLSIPEPSCKADMTTDSKKMKKLSTFTKKYKYLLESWHGLIITNWF